jgi:hypothetical protein
LVTTVRFCDLPDRGRCQLAALRRSLLGWLGTANAAGLDEDGIVALFTSALQDFRQRRDGSGDRRGSAGWSAAGPPEHRVSRLAPR